MTSLCAWLEQCQREDSPWVYETAPDDLPRQPVRGRGGKPTGEYLPTGKESVAMMNKMYGADEMARVKSTKRAELQERGPDMDLARQQKDSASAILAPLDALAREMEKKWGVGRLQTLVSPEWAEKFHSASVKLNAAIDKSDLVAIRERAEILMRGLRKLDELAAGAGHEPWGRADVWEVQSPGGRLYAICRSQIDEKNMERYDGMRVITLDEVARIIDAWDADGFVTELRAQFPGSQIVKAGRIHPDDAPDAGV